MVLFAIYVRHGSQLLSVRHTPLGLHYVSFLEDVRVTERQLKGVMKGRDQLLVSTLARRLPYRCSRGPGSALGEKGKKSASKGSEEVVWGGERVAAFPSAQTTAGLASLTDIFPL